MLHGTTLVHAAWWNTQSSYSSCHTQFRSGSTSTKILTPTHTTKVLMDGCVCTHEVTHTLVSSSFFLNLVSFLNVGCIWHTKSITSSKYHILLFWLLRSKLRTCKIKLFLAISRLYHKKLKLHAGNDRSLFMIIDTGYAKILKLHHAGSIVNFESVFAISRNYAGTFNSNFM